MLVAEARLVDHVEFAAMALLEGERLVERQAQLARHHVEPCRDSRLASSAAVFSTVHTTMRRK